MQRKYYFNEDGSVKYGEKYKYLAKHIIIMETDPEHKEGYTPVARMHPFTKEGYWDYEPLKQENEEIE